MLWALLSTNKWEQELGAGAGLSPSGGSLRSDQEGREKDSKEWTGACWTPEGWELGQCKAGAALLWVGVQRDKRGLPIHKQPPCSGEALGRAWRRHVHASRCSHVPLTVLQEGAGETQRCEGGVQAVPPPRQLIEKSALFSICLCLISSNGAKKENPKNKFISGWEKKTEKWEGLKRRRAGNGPVTSKSECKPSDNTRPWPLRSTDVSVSPSQPSDLAPAARQVVGALEVASLGTLGGHSDHNRERIGWG